MGVVFKITPAGAETVLHDFGSGADGAQPTGSLLQGKDGSLYGTTSAGGVANQGVIFRITAAGAEAVLYSFIGMGVSTDGRTPSRQIIQANDGNFYGTNEYGGSHGSGTVFKLTRVIAAH